MTDPLTPTNTHHVTLQDRDGNSVGLILCNDRGEPAPVYHKTPVDRTALKTSSGQSQYSDFQYPYAPIVQDDWSSGRGALDFERDSTRYFDGYRVNTHRANKAYLGPQEQFSTMTNGLLSVEWRVPEQYLCYSFPSSASADVAILEFTPTASFTMTKLWMLVKRTTESTATLRLDSNIGHVASTTITIADNVSQWVEIDFGTVALSSLRTYTVYATGGVKGFKYGYKNSDVSAVTVTEACYIAEGANTNASAIFYEYKGQQYKVVNKDDKSAPSLWMNGDRGTCDSNAGQKTKLIDATKTWTTNEWAGCVAKIIYGPGKGEYKTVASNTGTDLVFAEEWLVTHTTSSEYVILGSNKWTKKTGHGLTTSVTSVLVVNYVAYFAQGDSVAIRKHQAYNNSGSWVETDWTDCKDDADVSQYAIYLAYMPRAGQIWRGQNNDVRGNVSVSHTAAPADYASLMAFSGEITVGDKYTQINGMQCYPNGDGVESMWVYKEDIPWIVLASAEEITLPEMKVARSEKNGAALMLHSVYSFFTLGNGLQRYYGGSVEDVGPNIGEGLPAERTGPIVSLLGYPGRYFAVVDGGSSGYSSLLEHSGSGWHEVYRSRYGKRIRGMAYQNIPGSSIDRLWLYEGNITIWLPFASDAQSELMDSAYKYTHEGALILARMHAGMFNVQKLIKSISIWSDNLGDGQSLEVDYRLDSEETWTATSGTLTSPSSSIDMTSVYGIAGKRIQLRIRFLTTDNTKTPILLAAIVDAVLRTQIKYIYNLTFRVMDDEPTLMPRRMDATSSKSAGKSALTKLTQIEEWADADSDSMLYMTSDSPLYNGKYVFLNPPITRHIAGTPEPGRKWAANMYICTTTAQEA